MISTTNLEALQCWAAAHARAGDAMLVPFGMSAEEIDAVLTVGPDVHRLWAEAEPALVVPRQGLLPLLATGDGFRIRRHIRAASGAAGLTQELNEQLFTAWMTARDEPTLCHRLSLSAADREVLGTATREQSQAWSRLDIALGVPRPGRLPALFAAAEPALTGFLRDLNT